MALENPVQMKLYTLTKRQYLLVFLVFFAAYATAVIIGIAGPKVLHEVSTKHITNNASSVSFQLRSPMLNHLNQQLWLLAQFKRKSSAAGASVGWPFNVSLSVSGAEDLTDVIRSNHARKLQCEESVCDDLVLFHGSYINYNMYLASVRFKKADEFMKGVSSINFTWKFYNSKFTHFDLWFRFGFLVMAFIATCVFVYSLRRFKFRNWSIEQKWMSILLLLLCLYNGPLEPLKFLVSSWIPLMLDGIFQATFLSALLMFWLCTLHGIRETRRGIFSFYLVKMVIIFFIWLAAVTMSSWQQYNELEDPGFNTGLDTKNFTGFRIFFYVIVGIYVLYLLYLIVRAIVELRNMSFYSIRLKFLLCFMSIVLTVSIAIMVVRFGSAFLEPSYLTSPKTEYHNGAEFLAFYGLLNISMFTMAFVYSPSKTAILELNKDAIFSLRNQGEDTSHLFGSQRDDTDSDEA